MRIAHVAPMGEHAGSGIVTAVAALSGALAQRGHQVTVWQLSPWDRQRMADPLGVLERAGVGCALLSLRPRRGSPVPAAVLPGDQAVDLVHLHSVFVPANIAVARAWRGPYVVSPHGGYDPVSLRRRRFRKLTYGRLFERALLRGAALVTALTTVEQQQVLRYAGPVPTAVVPNGVAMPPASPAADRAADHLRRSLGLAGSQRLAVYVGRLDVLHKGLDLLLDALASAPSWRLLLVGPDHRGGQAALEERARRLRVEPRVHFAGAVDAAGVCTALRGADAFVLASRWEGLPMALLEALACGVPAVVSPAVERVVGVAAAGAGWAPTHGQFGPTLEAVPHRDETAWQDKRAAARSLAAAYDWASVAARYEAVYQQLLLPAAA